MGLLEGKLFDLDSGLALNEAENYFQIKESDIKSKSRKKEFVEPRHFCYYVLRKLDYTLKQIADFFNVDHSTIIHGVNKFNSLTELVKDGFCNQDDINIVEKSHDLINKLWLQNHENKAA